MKDKNKPSGKLKKRICLITEEEFKKELEGKTIEEILNKFKEEINKYEEYSNENLTYLSKLREKIIENYLTNEFKRKVKETSYFDKYDSLCPYYEDLKKSYESKNDYKIKKIELEGH
ncbi:MAG: hypothetical protein QW273_01095 [Candidatus Pacearchaeota archaeon]